MKWIWNDQSIRRGISSVDTAVVVAVIGIAVATGAYYTAGGANSELEQTSQGIADPAALANQFGSQE